MKKIITLLSMAFCINASAQIINPGFETWTTDFAVPTAMNPNSGNGTWGWWDYNMFHSSFVGTSPVSVFRCDTFHTGSYSARVETVIYTAGSYSLCAPWGVPFIGHNYLDTLGILFNGNTNESTITYKPGIACTQKINQFSFWYQYKPNGIDTAECRVMLLNNHNPVAGGLVKLTTVTGSTWQQATITMTYVSALTPDTLYVLFSSSSLDKKPKPGSVFLIDDVSVTLLSGIDQVSANNEQVTIYPNPATNSFQVALADNVKTSTIHVYDINGKIVLSQTINGTSTINTSNLNAGIYNLSIISNNGIFNKRLVIAR